MLAVLATYHRSNVSGWNSIYILNINSVNAIWKRITYIWMFSVPICLFIQRFPLDILSHHSTSCIQNSRRQSEQIIGASSLFFGHALFP